MKKIAILILLFAALTAAAQEPTKLVQRLDLSSQKYLMIHIGGEYTSVAIYQDTADYVAVSNPLWNDSAQTSQPLFELTQSDILHTLWVGGNARSGVIEIHTKRDNLDIYSRLYNHVGINTKAGDTVRLRSIRLQADDYSMMEIESPLVAEDVMLVAEKHSTIYYHTYQAERYSENTKDYGIIYGGMRNGESLAKKHHLLEYNTDGYKMFEHRYRPAQRLHLSVTAALLSAGRKPLSGFGWTENTYPDREVAFPDMKTTLGCYQLAVSYDIVCRKHFAFSLGLEYSYNRFKFKDPYVDYLHYDQENMGDYMLAANDYLTPMEPPYGGGDSLQYWSSQLTAKYVAIPIGVTYYADKNHRKGFHVGLELVPCFGINEGNIRRSYSQWDEMESSNTTEGFVINSHQPIYLSTMVDLRLSIGWGAWSVVVQGNPDAANWAFSFCTNGIIAVYPFRLGVKVCL